MKVDVSSFFNENKNEVLNWGGLKPLVYLLFNLKGRIHFTTSSPEIFAENVESVEKMVFWNDECLIEKKI